MWAWLRRLGQRWRAATPTEEWPEPLRRYMAAQKPCAFRTPLSEARFVVFDTETTGLDVRRDHLLTIAAVSVMQGDVRLDDGFETVVARTEVGGADAATVHGLVPADLVAGESEEGAVCNFLAFAGDAILVAHHALFDIEMLKKGIRDFGGARVWNRWIDTADLTRRLEQGPLDTAPSSQSYSLDAVTARYNIDISDRHTAAGDALATALLLQVLLKNANRRGIHTLKDLLRRR